MLIEYIFCNIYYKNSHLNFIVSVQDQYYYQVSWCITLWYGADKPARNNTDLSFLLTSLWLKVSWLLSCLSYLSIPWLEFWKLGNPLGRAKLWGRRVHHSAACKSKRHPHLRENNICFQITFLWKGSKHLITIITSFLVISVWVSIVVWLLKRWRNYTWQDWPMSTKTEGWRQDGFLDYWHQCGYHTSPVLVYRLPMWKTVLNSWEEDESINFNC